MLPDTVTCYLDSTVALPLLTAYALSSRPARKPRRLMDRLDGLMKALETEYGSRRKQDDEAGQTKEEKVDPEAPAEIDRIR